MSVINKMLRDLDSRADEPGAGSARRAAPMSVILGTASITALPVTRVHHGRRPGWMIPLPTLLAGLLVAAVWWFGFAGRMLPLPAPLPPHAAASMVPGSSAPPTPVTPAMASTAVSGQPAPLAMPPSRDPASVESAELVRSTQLGLAAAGLAGPNTGTVKAAPVMPAASPRAGPAGVQTTPIPAQLPSTAALAPVTVPAQAAPAVWQDAALDTVGQAQRLWAAGARDSALDLLREAMLVLERSHGAELATTGSAATLALVRELARMELAQGQPAAALALLQKYERLLPGRADLWALRANAAQRVGQHAQAGEAYRAALQIRPGEPRWMLGAAVSLAAQGQLVAAAELAEQARAIEAVSPEVLAYLRQLGVQLRDR